MGKDYRIAGLQEYRGQLSTLIFFNRKGLKAAQGKKHQFALRFFAALRLIIFL
jgi:hypothetical protein